MANQHFANANMHLLAENMLLMQNYIVEIYNVDWES